MGRNPAAYCRLLWCALLARVASCSWVTYHRPMPAIATETDASCDVGNILALVGGNRLRQQEAMSMAEAFCIRKDHCAFTLQNIHPPPSEARGPEHAACRHGLTHCSRIYYANQVRRVSSFLFIMPL